MAFRVRDADLDEIARSRFVQDHLAAIAEAGAEGCRDGAPVDTGFLRDSYGSEPTPDGKGYRFGNTKYPVSYVADVEFGTWRAMAQPHIRTSGVEAARRRSRGR